MIVIYHVPGTRGFRTIWACEELGVDYRVEQVDMSAEYRASAEWRRRNPVGKVPAMTVGDLSMFESCAMTQYVLDRYGAGRLQPTPGTEAHARYLQWCWFAESTFARACGEAVNHRRVFGDAAITAVTDEMLGRATLCVDAVANELAESPYLLGDDFSAADIAMGYALMSYRRLMANALPQIVDSYWMRLAGRPAFEAAVAAEKP